MQRDLFSLEGKSILITGTTGWLGSHMEEMFKLCDPWTVVSLNRKDYGDFYNGYLFQDALKKLVHENNFDVLINNAYDLSEKTGFNTDKGTLEKADGQIWDLSFRSGIYWAATATKIIGERMKKIGRGSIINISSMYGVVSPHPDLYEGEKYFNPVTYSTMKHGLIGLTKYTAAFWGKHGIRCNAVAPGPFPRDDVQQKKEFMDKLKERTLLGRVGHRTDLDGVLVWLASNASNYVTGQVIQVDGGWTVT